MQALRSGIGRCGYGGSEDEEQRRGREGGEEVHYGERWGGGARAGTWEACFNARATREGLDAWLASGTDVAAECSVHNRQGPVRVGWVTMMPRPSANHIL